MSPELLAYPFLFIAIFFESFVLVTLLSKPARDARARLAHVPGDVTPTVAVIVPCYNEADTIAGTGDSLLALDYPENKLEIILVNDGSTDGTRAAMERFADNPRVRIIHKENGGKHTALNAGIASTNAEFVGCLDADSFVEPDALRELVSAFTSPNIAAVTAAMSVHNPHNIVQHMQNAEYSFGTSMRHAIASINGLYVTPGPFSFYRRSVIEKLGGFCYGHQTEDMEMALRIQRAGYEIENAPHARVYTTAPDTIRKLVRQRTRWTSGFLRHVFGEYRSLVMNRDHGALGMLMLPSSILAIGSGMLLFFLAIFEFVRNSILALQVRSDIPLSYVFQPRPSLDWFYFPSGMYLFLTVLVLLASFTLITFGRRLSRAPMRLPISLVSYALIYGFVVPFWLMRATADVAFGKQRAWK